MNFEQRPQAARYSPPLHFLGGLFMVLAVSGCMSTSKVVADDQHVFIPSLRAAVSLEDDKRPAAEPQTGRTIEFGFAKAKGGGDQFLAPGQSPITLNNTTFIAPQQMRNNFDFNYAEAAFRWRKFFRERSLGIEVAGGVGRASLDLDVMSSTQAASQHFATYGPQGGFALIWRMRPSTSLHARVSGFVSRSSTGVRDLGRYEIFLAQALGDNLALRVGYAKWEINGDGGEGQSDFRTTFYGPILDLGLNF